MELTSYLLQECTYQDYTVVEATGDKQYGPIQTIPCRKTFKKKKAEEKGTDKILNVTTYLIEDVVPRLGALIDGEEILAFEDFVDFDGSVIGYRVFPRPPLGWFA